jgi:hypothetical protein
LANQPLFGELCAPSRVKVPCIDMWGSRPPSSA